MVKKIEKSSLFTITPYKAIFLGVAIVLAAFVIPGAVSPYWPPSLLTSEAGFNDIVIHARGTNGDEKIALYINENPVQFWDLATNFQDYIYTPPDEISVSTLSVHFLNDRWEPQNGINYDVQVDYITVNGTKYESEHSSTVSTGSWDQDGWCAPGNKNQEWLHCSGKFTYNVPAGTIVGLPGGGSGGPICGNSLLEVGEQCDDGNVIEGDGCDAVCVVEGASGVVSISVVPNGFHGGGFVSNVSISVDGETVYGGGDVSGVHRSDDAGSTFHTKNLGLRSLKIASLRATPDNPAIVYAGTGDKGNSGGLYYSQDSGNTWQLTAASAQAQSGATDNESAAFFAGNHPADEDPIPDAHPRPNGNLIAVDNGNSPDVRSDDIVIAGTYKHGVQIFSEGGDTHESTVLNSGFVRGVSINSAVPNIAYAAVYFSNATSNGIYEINYSNITSPVVSLAYATSEPEEVVLLANGHVYAAIGTNGIAGYDGVSWSTLNDGLLFDSNNTWQGITGYTRSAGDVIYIGVNNSTKSSGSHYSNIWRSVDGGVNWSPLVDQSTNVFMDVYDGDTTDGGGDYWWFRDAFGEATFGRRNTVVSSIVVAHDNDDDVTNDEVYVSGRGGIWKSDDGGGQWYPAVYNYQASTNRDVAVNPNNPSQVIIGNTDYTLMEGVDRLVSGDVERDRPFDPYLSSNAGSRGYDVLFDAVSDQAILAAGDRDENEEGEVFIKNAVDIGNLSEAWTSLGLGPITTESGNTSGNRVRAVTYGYHNGTTSTTQTILAAVEGQGIYRYQDGSWSQSTTNVPITNTQRSNFMWPDRQNSGVVYLVDLSAGIYRSVDGGQNWQNIWPGMTLNNADFWTSGYIAADEGDPSVIYLSVQGRSSSYIGTDFRVYRLEDADDPATFYGDPSTDPNVIDITNHSGGTEIQRSSTLKVDSVGRLWLTQQQHSPGGDEASLFLMENPKNDTTFTDLTTQEYRQSMTEPIGMDISTDGYIYVAQRGLGVMKILIQEN